MSPRSARPAVDRGQRALRLSQTCVVLLSALTCHPAFALDPLRDVLEYDCRTWTRQNGLLANGVNAVTQTRDGYVWLGTSMGLLRFDGLEFRLFDLAHERDVRNTTVLSLASASAGGLWVGLANCGVAGFFDGQSFSFKGREIPTGPDLDIQALLESKTGKLWLAAGRVFQLTPSGDYEALTLDASAEFDVNVLCAYEDSQGRLWFGTINSGAYFWQAGKVTHLSDPTLETVLVNCVVEDREGQIWLGTTQGLKCYGPDLRPREIPELTAEIRALLVDRHGALWIGTSGQGLARFQQGGYRFLRKTDGLAGEWVNALAEDREGNLWVGTRDGLNLITDVKFPTYPATEDPQVKEAWAVGASRRGGAWIASDAGITYFDGRPQAYSTEAGLPKSFVKRVFEARNGDVYLVSDNSDLVILSGGKVVAHHDASPGLVVGITEDAQGVVVSVGGALYRATRNELKPYAFPNGEPPFVWILNLVTGRDGAIWVSSVSGIFRIKDGAFQQWAGSEDLVHRAVQWICEDDDGIVWGALLKGIIRLKDGQVRWISRSDGLFDDNIYAIVPDDFGYLWVNSGRGIFRVSRQSLNDFADGRADHVECVPYDGPESVQPADKGRAQERVACKTPDGRIWFPGGKGAVVIDPAHVPTNGIVPPVYINRVLANGRESAGGKPIVVPPGHGELEFHFTALSFIASHKIQFRYQLRGYDTDWVEAGDRRMAFYTNLKPGRYSFRVIAANADGVWNSNGDTLEIKLQPHFHQTIWFYLLCGGLALGVLAALYRSRVRLLKHKAQALQENRILLETEVRNRTAELRESLTALKLAQEAAARKEAQFRFIFESVPVGIAWMLGGRLDTRILNPAYERLSSVTAAQCRQLELYRQATHPDDRERQDELHRRLVAGEIEQYAMEKRYVHGDGAIVWAALTVRFFRDPVTAETQEISTLVDITGLKRSEAELAYERDLLRAFLDTCPDAIYFKDRESRFLRCSHSMARALKFPNSDPLIGRSDVDFFDPELAGAARVDEQQIMRTGVALFDKTERAVGTGGRVTWTLSSKMPLRNVHGEIIGTMGISRDITPIKEAEEKVADSHRQLVEISRQAGMAEVATGVLHNVGNVLNSVNVSTILVAERLHHSEIGKLEKVCALLRQADGDLPGFFARDPRGGKLPGFLESLHEQLAAEQGDVMREVEQLRKNVEHIKEIVAMQQSYASVSGVTESIAVIELINDAIRMNAGALMRHEVRLVRDFQTTRTITVEKHKVLQILVNLIRNAKYACDDSDRPDKVLTLRVTSDESEVRITVTDNGVGIPAENLTRIFSHGFTTRKEGHGFGLHSGALAARELGGSLTAFSEGPGRGAAFVFVLPHQRECQVA